MLKVAFLNQDARLPTRGSSRAAGYDLYAAGGNVNVCYVEPGARKLVSTGISIAIPPGHYGRIAPRSGLALKHGIQVGAGVIDEDYRGEVGVLLFNHGEHPFRIEKGDRIAQLIIESIFTPIVKQFELVELDSTERGDGGFGSTGV